MRPRRSFSKDLIVGRGRFWTGYYVAKWACASRYEPSSEEQCEPTKMAVAGTEAETSSDEMGLHASTLVRPLTIMNQLFVPP